VSILTSALRPKIIVTKKLIELKIEEIPAKCKEKIIRSNLLLKKLEERGGYKVHPPPGPSDTKRLRTKTTKDGPINQNLKLFKRGKTKSTLPPNKGTIQFPKTPISTGIIIKKIINSA